MYQIKLILEPPFTVKIDPRILKEFYTREEGIALLETLIKQHYREISSLKYLSHEDRNMMKLCGYASSDCYLERITLENSIGYCIYWCLPTLGFTHKNTVYYIWLQNNNKPNIGYGVFKQIRQITSENKREYPITTKEGIPGINKIIQTLNNIRRTSKYAL